MLPSFIVPSIIATFLLGYLPSVLPFFIVIFHHCCLSSFLPSFIFYLPSFLPSFIVTFLHFLSSFTFTFLHCYLHWTSVKPVISSIDGPDKVVQGRDLYLTCNVSVGDPQPTVTWDVDGMLLVPSGDRRISQPEALTLQVKFVSGSDRGRYRCTASNAAGLDSRSVDVSVVGPWNLSLFSLSS